MKTLPRVRHASVKWADFWELTSKKYTWSAETCSFLKIAKRVLIHSTLQCTVFRREVWFVLLLDVRCFFKCQASQSYGGLESHSQHSKICTQLHNFIQKENILCNLTYTRTVQYTIQIIESWLTAFYSILLLLTRFLKSPKNIILYTLENMWTTNARNKSNKK